jgi:hypothetical protein
MFKMDKQVDLYSRSVYTIMGVLRDVGGFYNSLFFAGLLLYSRFQGTIIFSKLVSKLYQIEQVENDETLISNESPKKLSESSSSASKLGRQKSLTKKKT